MERKNREEKESMVKEGEDGKSTHAAFFPLSLKHTHAHACPQIHHTQAHICMRTITLTHPDPHTHHLTHTVVENEKETMVL